MSLGTLWVFFSYTRMLVWPLCHLGRVLADRVSQCHQRFTRCLLAVEVEEPCPEPETRHIQPELCRL